MNTKLHMKGNKRRGFFKIGFIILPIVIFMTFIPFHRSGQQSKPVISLLKSGKYNMEIFIENVTNLYAASVDLYYDPKILNIERLETGDLFLECGSPWMECVNSIDADEGVARFAVSLMGDVQAIEGTGVLVKIHYRIVNNKKPGVKILDHRMAGSVDDHEFSIVPTLVSADIEYIPYASMVQIDD